MQESPEALPSTRPYLVRALHAWCTDHGFTPYLQARVGRGVQVPHEYAQDGVITLNISYDATQGLSLDNDHIGFKARFGGVAREVWVPMDAVLALFARENGQGMVFGGPDDLADADADGPLEDEADESAAAQSEPLDRAEAPALRLAPKPGKLGDNPPPEPPGGGSRPTLKRIK